MKSKFHQVFFLYVAQSSNLLVPLVVTPLIVASVGLDGFGRYATTIAAIQLSVVLTEFGFDLIGPRRLAKEGSGGHSSVYIEVVFSKLILMLLVLVVYAVLVLVDALKFRPVHVFSMLAWQLGVALQATWWCVFAGKALLNSVSVVLSRIFLLLAIFGVVKNFEGNEDWLLAGTSCAYLLSGLVVFPSVLSSCPRFVLKPMRHYVLQLREAFSDFLSVAAGSALNYAPVICLGVFSGDSSSGAFASVDRVARVMSAALKPLFQFMYPRSVALQSKALSVRRTLFLNVLSVWLAFVFFVMTSVYVLGEHLLSFMYGEELIRSGGLFILFSLIGWLLVGILNNLIGIQGLVAAGRSGLYAKIMWVGALLNLAIVFCAVSLAGQSVSQFLAFAVMGGEILITGLLLVWGGNENVWRRAS